MTAPNGPKPNCLEPYSWTRVVLINLLAPGAVLLFAVAVASYVVMVKPFGYAETADAFIIGFVIGIPHLVPALGLGLNIHWYRRSKGVPERREAARKFRIMIFLYLGVWGLVVIGWLLALTPLISELLF